MAATGRSTARLDDEPVTAARLADVAGPLVEIHGQHEQQRLLDERWQRDLLDAFGGHEPLRATMTGAVDRWRANRAALAELELDPRELARRLEIAEHEATEIAAARLRPGEATEIRAQLDAAQHGEAIARGSATLHDALAAEERGARDASRPRAARGARPRPARRAVRGARRPDRGPRGGVRTSRPRRPRAGGVRRARPRGARSRSRSGSRAIYALERRYGDDEAAVIAHGERAAAEAERLRGLETERDAAPGRGRAAPGRGRRGRGGTVGRPGGGGTALTEDVGGVLVELGFPAGVFEVALGRRAGRTRTSRRSSSTATRSRSMRPASTRSCSGSRRTPASRPGRWPGSPRAGR